MFFEFVEPNIYPSIVITISLKASKPFLISSLLGFQRESRIQRSIRKRHQPSIDDPRANHEYVDKEEHDAKIMSSGMVLSEYYIYLDNGDIEKIQ